MSALFFFLPPLTLDFAHFVGQFDYSFSFRLKLAVILQFDNAVLILARIDFKPINEFNKTNILFGL